MSDLDDRLALWNPVKPADVSGAAGSMEARRLLQSVLSEGARQAAGARSSRPRKPRLGTIAVAASVAAAAVIAGLVLGVSSSHDATPYKPPPNEQLVAFSIRHGFVTALITNPLAAASQLTAVLRAHGLNITVQTVPVSPSLVGTIVYGDAPAIRTLWKRSCRFPGCPVGLVIPAGYTGRADIAVGRPARPGETYRTSADVFAPGEVLHCSGLLGAPATTALQVLRRLRLHATWRALGWPNWPVISSTDASSPHHERPAGYIIEGDPASAHQVDLGTLPALPHNPQFRDLVEKWNRGCN